MRSLHRHDGKTSIFCFSEKIFLVVLGVLLCSGRRSIFCFLRDTPCLLCSGSEVLRVVHQFNVVVNHGYVYKMLESWFQLLKVYVLMFTVSFFFK